MIWYVWNWESWSRWRTMLRKIGSTVVYIWKENTEVSLRQVYFLFLKVHGQNICLWSHSISTYFEAPSLPTNSRKTSYVTSKKCQYITNCKTSSSLTLLLCMQLFQFIIFQSWRNLPQILIILFVKFDKHQKLKLNSTSVQVS